MLAEKLKKPYVHILFGARQTGKSTLLKTLIPKPDLFIDLSNPEERSRYLARPGDLVAECRALSPAGRTPPLVFIDEVQAVPEMFNAVQNLYDGDKHGWRFILCGSSARKLRQTGANMLPGRSMLHRLYPLTLAEHPSTEHVAPNIESPLPFPWDKKEKNPRPFPAWDLFTRLTYGELPGIVTADKEDRAGLLKSYAIIHLEEEIRREALIKDWGAFTRFLQLAAMESGTLLNYANISQHVGVSQPTIKSYYQLLEDMFVGFSVPAFSKSPRKNLLSTPKFFFFDTGVRHAAARLEITQEIVKANPGPVFEQWVGTELWKRLQYSGGTLYHLRTKDGAEIDFIVEHKGRYVPVEVKWTEHPSLSDARHILRFLDESPDRKSKGYIICRCSKPMLLHDRVMALPWFHL
ncbi:MAG: hypothetical protein A2283_02160 [Lentisphaerae bacterium RIFOXYA12_FULL_48_11]|nr:MAG: hypothetical protein A2283_02160 [Lentisphaerae bacterium RIFOXYA12_FULL_48_11]